MKRLALILVSLAACVRPRPQPLDSISLQARARSEEARFNRAVAEEAKTPRLALEAVSDSVFVDRPRGLVYLLAPTLLALDLATGDVRWARPDVGGTFARVGGSLVVVGAESAKQPVLWFLTLAPSPTAPSLQRCALKLPVPAEADVVTVLPFDRAGVPYAYFASSARGREGGPPPAEHELQHAEASRACGVVELSSCEVRPRPLERFFLDPPRDLGAAVELSFTDCRYVSPAFEMPAVVASRPPVAAPGVFPQLTLVHTPLSPTGCVTHQAVRLDATDAAGRVAWSRALAEEVSADRCPGPP